MIVLGIDPGKEKSGYILWDTEKERPVLDIAGHIDNKGVMKLIALEVVDLVAIERIRGYGIVAGDDTFDTCEWVGAFENEAIHAAKQVCKVPRKDIKKALCGNTTTNDKYVRQALIDRFGDVGTKKNPGPLYGVSGHVWAALACAVVAGDLLRR